MLKVEVTDQKIIQKLALKKGINFRYFKDNFIGISLNETTTVEDVQDILYIFASAKQVAVANVSTNKLTTILPSSLQRNTPFLEHPVFNQYHTEHEMLRYLKRLENKDLSLVHSMISLGSCTMKLNASTEMIPLSWQELAKIHPFVPKNQAKGYHQLFAQLADWLSEMLPRCNLIVAHKANLRV